VTDEQTNGGNRPTFLITDNEGRHGDPTTAVKGIERENIYSLLLVCVCHCEILYFIRCSLSAAACSTTLMSAVKNESQHSSADNVGSCVPGSQPLPLIQSVMDGQTNGQTDGQTDT